MLQSLEERNEDVNLFARMIFTFIDFHRSKKLHRKKKKYLFLFNTFTGRLINYCGLYWSLLS